MNIKEQNEFKLVQILNKYFPDILLETLSECANEIIQAGYVQLQADSEGLVEIINPCGICEYNCPQEKKETCVMYQYYTIKILALKAQKALCDAEFRKEKNVLVVWLVKIIKVLKYDKFSTAVAISGLEAMVKILEELK